MDFSSENLIESTDVDLPSQEAPVTYDGLLDRGAAQLQSSQKRQSIANMCSALRGWMRAHGFVGSRLVQDDFEAGFDHLMLRFDAYLKQTVGPRTRRDRQEQLVQWRQVFNALRNVDTLPRGFREALAVIMSARCVNIATLAANVNMPPNTLGNWLSGKVTPRGKSIAHVSALERQLDVPSGTLLNRLPAGRRGSHLSRTAGVVLETTYTKRRRAQLAQVREYRLPFAGSIAEEWEALLRHKTDPATAEDEDETRKRRGTWRLKSIESQAQRVEPWMLLDYSVCATAGVHWGIFASYLGWLRLPRPQGAGVKPDGRVPAHGVSPQPGES
jgi:hypothetical protein